MVRNRKSKAMNLESILDKPQNGVTDKSSSELKSSSKLQMSLFACQAAFLSTNLDLNERATSH